LTPKKPLPALLGGLFMGVLSVLPIISTANVCCCLWVIVGGALAAWVMQQNHPLPITLAQGASVGLLAGLIGFVVMLAASIPVAYLQGTPLDGFSESLLRQEGMTPEMREVLQQVGPGVIAGLAATVAFFANITFGAIGGLLGAAIFRTSAPLPPPAVPPEPPMWLLNEVPPLDEPPPVPPAPTTDDRRPKTD
jgi:hypothetical protein